MSNDVPLPPLPPNPSAKRKRGRPKVKNKWPSRRRLQCNIAADNKAFDAYFGSVTTFAAPSLQPIHSHGQAHHDNSAVNTTTLINKGDDKNLDKMQLKNGDDLSKVSKTN